MGQIRVLHVDDDRSFGELTAEWLERGDDRFEVVTETSGAAGLDRLAAEGDAIDCVVSDYQMPGMDGLAFLDAVREEYPQLPFILFTGKGSEEVASDAIARDATDYLQKRGGTEQYDLLANRIENAVEQYRSQRRLERKKQEYQHLFEQAPVMFAVFRDEDGVPVVEDCNQQFADKLGYDIERLRGEPIRTFFTEDSYRKAIEGDGYERALSGDLTTEERTLLTADGETLDVMVRGVPRTDAAGEVTGVLALYVDLTEQKERERELEEARAFYETVVEESHDGVRIVQDGTVTYVDDRFAEMTGYQPDELVGEPSGTAIAPEYEDLVRESHEARVRDETTPSRYEVELETKDGDRRVVELSVAKIEQDGSPASLTLFRDITDRKERERELERQKERLDTVLSNVPLIVYALDRDGVFTLSEGKGLEKLGLEPGEVVGESLFDVYADHEGICSDTERALDGERVTVTREVEGLFFETTLQPVFDEDGTVRAVIGVAIDVTERVERERERQRERDRLETLFENLPNPVLYGTTVNGDHLVKRVNPAFEETFGYSQEEIAGKRGTDLIVPDDCREQARERLTHAVEEGSITAEVQRETAAGRREFRVDTAVTNPESGDPERYTIYTDITERKEREQELRRYEAIVEAIDDAIYVVDEAGRIEYVNERYAEMKGLDREELIGSPIRRWADDEAVARIDDLIAELERGERDVGKLEYEFTTADGQRIPAELRFTDLEFPDGGQGRVGMIRDITERRERERELERQNERLDEFVSVVSHDLRNPLNALAGSLEVIETDDTEVLERCQRSVDRMNRLIDDLLTLARHGETIAEPARVDLADVATDAWETVETPGVGLSVRTDASIVADESRLRQLLENLFRNAVEHGSTGPGPESRQVAGKNAPSSNRPQSDDTAAHGGTVEEVTVGSLPDGFYVADDGRGIPEDEREKVFESGYSTATGGTGFGLSIVEGIASVHGWDVAVTESDGGGARFEITGVGRD